jgi:hypothetical protein
MGWIVADGIVRSVLRFCLFLPRLGGRLIGRTADSDSAYPGSSPGLPAKLPRHIPEMRFTLRFCSVWLERRVAVTNFATHGIVRYGRGQSML